MKKKKHKLSKTGKPSNIKFDIEIISEPKEEVVPEEGTFESYKWDVRQYLVEDSWHYSKDLADVIVDSELYRIKEGFDEGESIESVAADIGYFCG